jgi:putative endonuclease
MFSLFKKDIKQFGEEGEDLAVKYLRKRGCEILDRNFRIRSGEIDIVAKDGEDLVFVEVKTRRKGDPNFLPEAVNHTKIKKIVRTAEYYIMKRKAQNMPARFDVLFIVNNNGKAEIDHIKSAFSL